VSTCSRAMTMTKSLLAPNHLPPTYPLRIISAFDTADFSVSHQHRVFRLMSFPPSTRSPRVGLRWHTATIRRTDTLGFRIETLLRDCSARSIFKEIKATTFPYRSPTLTRLLPPPLLP